jgi:hypothetical protein
VSQPELGPEPPEDDNWVPFSGAKAWMGGDASAAANGAPDGYDPGPYVDLVKDLLAAEQARVERMEARGLAVVTTSGTLATLLLGIAALVVRRQDVRIEDSALLLVALAAIAFVLAAGLAIAANRPTRAWNVKPERVRDELRERWGREAPQDRPQQKATATRLAIWRSLHGLSQAKAVLVFAAMIVEAVAVALLAGAVVIILL